MSIDTDPAEAARQARAEQRSAQLLEAAARLMDRDGPESVSMQSLATEAGVSVGLIYRYFGGKDELLLAVILNVLDAFGTEVPKAMDEAGEDPVHRLAAGVRALCEVIDDQRYAVVLTYRATKQLSPEGRHRIMELELSTMEPLREALRAGQKSGAFEVIDVDLETYNVLLLTHSWALKHWYYERRYTVEEFATMQTAIALRALIPPRQRRKYAALLGNAGA
ncbi:MULTISPECIES: TetR/AcrR family transcriptional regulator [unclassified Nocardioides]|uniref:TetR/AcrR family transcriptional regulator n=1 Tax=unclassified Nocardioides TaxID=2615069 RepID=UPI0006F9A599|nr:MULTISPECIES: TetR/AcrR family transcriptional regulator [unclassified Nocardioides]KQY57608.1 TetR family transcriptional regulator [Nocardioides sp. Root140]KRF15096.1 TetR family transcriptional regulator [Nocardioides sp. Soil796]